MIPVPDTEIELYDVYNEKNQAYKDLVEEEIIYIRKNEKKIKKNAQVLYSKKKSGTTTNKVVANCIDYIAAEKECDRWIEIHHNETN
jgi:protein AbiQ